MSASPTSTSTGCANATVTDAIRAALVVADTRPAAIEQPGMTYYGICGSVAYAVASFEPSATATTEQSVAFQDHGAYPEFFTRSGDNRWQLVGSASGPPGPADCTAFTKAPSALRALWQDCVSTQTQAATPSSPAATASPSSSVNAACSAFAAHTFAQLVAATAGPDDTTTATAHPATVSCGGPDDHHYVISTQSETVQLPASAHISVLDGSGEMTATSKQLAASLASNGPGVFQISGPISAATSITQEFIP